MSPKRRLEIAARLGGLRESPQPLVDEIANRATYNQAWGMGRTSRNVIKSWARWRLKRIAMRMRLDARAKTLRAFRAYLDLQTTTDWIRAEMRVQLEMFGMTLAGFRVLELLYREGATHMNEAARRLECDRRNLHIVVKALEEKGLVLRERGTLRPVDNHRNRKLKATGDTGRKGREVTRLRLTAAGKKFIANLFPRHAKVVKSLMRALHGREQETLSKLCRKLRGGDFMKFVTELRYLRAGEEFEIDPEDLQRELEEIRRELSVES